MKNLRISSGLTLHSFPTDDPFEYIRQGLEYHKRAGFDAVDLSLNFYTNLLGDRPQPILERALDYANSIGMPIELTHLPFTTESKPEDPAHFSARMHLGIDCAKLLGVAYAAIHPATPTLPMDQYDRKQQFEAVVADLAPYVEHAKRIGVNLAVENMRPLILPVPYHRYCSQADELCEVADALDIGCCWDFGHAHISGVKQSEGLACVGERLKMLHINDNHAAIDVHLAPWLGTIDWADAMQGLSAIGFEGLLNYEIIATNQPAAVREAYGHYLVDAAKELRRLL